MSDFDKLINASDLIGWIMEAYPDWCEGDIRVIVNHIEQLPSAQSEQRWIPCSERLPKYPFRVQIQLDNGWIITGYYSEEHWYTVPHCGGFLRNDEVEAWRELPEPYGGSDAK